MADRPAGPAAAVVSRGGSRDEPNEHTSLLTPSPRLDWDAPYTPRTPHEDEEEGELEPATKSAKSDPTVKEMRVIAPVKSLRHVRTTRSVASMILGERSEPERLLFQLVMKTYILFVLLFLWWVGAGIGLLAVSRIIPLYAVWGSLLMLPLPTVAFLVLSKDLVFEILNELEYYVLNILQTVLFVCAIYLLGDNRSVFWWCMLPTMGITTLADAYPQKFRKTFSKFYFTSQLGFIIAWNLLLITGWVKFDNVFYQIGRVQGGLAGCTFTTSLTLVIFYFRNMRQTYNAPDQFVIIKSAVRSSKEKMQLQTRTSHSNGSFIEYVPVEQKEVKGSRARKSEVHQAKDRLRAVQQHQQREQMVAAANAALQEQQTAAPEDTHPVPACETPHSVRFELPFAPTLSSIQSEGDMSLARSRGASDGTTTTMEDLLDEEDHEDHEPHLA